MESVDIKDISGNILLTTKIYDGCKRKFTLMKEDYITLKFSLDNPIYFKYGDSVDCDFGRFEICDLQKPSYNDSTGGYDYELRLDAYYWKWKNKIFKYTPEAAGQEASWNLTAPLDVQAGIVLRNLKALGYTYNGQDFDFSIDSTVENKALLMSYDNINILDACFEMAKKWGCECWVTENIIHFGRCEFGDPVDFEIGVNVKEMTRSDSQSAYATRVYAFGSTRNIPASYRPVDESVVVNGVVQKRLMLPVGTPYIDAYPNMSTEEAVEQVVVFDNVFPRRTGTMSNITTHEYTDTIQEEGKPDVVKKWNAYRFKDPGITFSKDYVLAGEELKITFQSGKLNGMTFEVTFNPCDKEGGETPIPEKNEDGSWNPAAQVWEIIRNEDYGRQLPGDVLVPEAGDTYILSGWDSTKIAELGLVDAAEQELKAETEKYVAKSMIDPGTYENRMASDRIYSGDGLHTLYDVGQSVNLVNAAFFESGSRKSRIIGLEYNLDCPYDHPVYTVGETAAYSRIAELEDKIESLTLKGQTYTGGGGSGVYLITSNDTTPATDSNAYSARRTLKMFLRKDKPDETNYLVKFLGGLHAGDFSQGSTGAGIYQDEQGNWHIETDYMHVRMKFTAKEVEIQRVLHIGGAQVKTSASMKCVRVEELEDAYRCYMNTSNEDGDVVYNQFKVDDQAYVQTFNLERQADGVLGNHFLWRLVTSTGKDYIDLSKEVVAAGSDIPKAGDDIVQLGYRGTDDPGRQVAVIDAGAGEGAPYYRQYVGINSFSLPQPETQLKPGDNRLTGQVHILPGSTGFENVSGMEFGKVNLLRNSGFTGDYNSAKLEDGTELEAETDLYSQALKFWAATGAVVNSDAASHSGRSVTLATGILVQTLYYKMMEGEKYILSFRAKGASVSVSCAGFEKTEQLTSAYQRFIYKFDATAGTELTVSGTCTVCELQLERGTVPSEWSISPLDNNSSEAKFEALRYLTDVIKNGSSTFIGGLGLLSMLKLGNYVDGEMKRETAGVSGVYNDDDDVAFYAGGNYEQAVRTVLEYLDNPNHELDEATLAEIAKVVITHGGRAILNDVIVRGYIYALGGVFKGNFDSGNGKTHLDADGTGWIGKIADEYFSKWDADGNGSLCFGNIKWNAKAKRLTVKGEVVAESGSKFGNLSINENGAMIGGNAVFEKIDYLCYPFYFGNAFTPQEEIDNYVRDLIVANIHKSTTMFLNINAGETRHTYTVNLPTKAELSAKGINSGYGFRLTLIATSSVFRMLGSSFEFKYYPTFRITSRPKKEEQFLTPGMSGNVELITELFPDGEIHDNNDNRMDYIDMQQGDVLELYYYGGIYYLLNRRY